MQHTDKQPRSNGASPASHTSSEPVPDLPQIAKGQTSLGYNMVHHSRPILPPIRPRYSSSSTASSTEPPSRRKRHQIPAACESCRKRKGKVMYPLKLILVWIIADCPTIVRWGKTYVHGLRQARRDLHLHRRTRPQSLREFEETIWPATSQVRSIRATPPLSKDQLRRRGTGDTSTYKARSI